MTRDARTGPTGTTSSHEEDIVTRPTAGYADAVNPPAPGALTALWRVERENREVNGLLREARSQLTEARAELDQLRGQHRWLNPGEPTGHVVVQTSADIPASIARHAMAHLQSGVMHHHRLGIHVVVLDEIDPERHRVKALQALGDLGIARERADRLRAENVEHEQRAELLRRQVDELTTERDAAVDEQERRSDAAAQARTEAERLRGLLAEALTGWETSELLRCADTHSHEGLCTDRRIAEIRREAGLA